MPGMSKRECRLSVADWSNRCSESYSSFVRRALVISIMLVSGCAPTPVGFDAPSETKRQDAIVRAAARHEADPETYRGLIEQLDSPDPATRFLAIHTLRRFTGQTFGYDYAAPPWKREQPVQAWVEWYDAQFEDRSGPARVDDE